MSGAVVISVSDFDAANFSFTPPKKNNRNKFESYATYNNRPVLLQFGSIDEPLTFWGPLERYVQSTNKFEKIDPADLSWSRNKNLYFNKATDKVQGKFRLKNYTESDTMDQKVYDCLKAIKDKLVDAFAHGVQNPVTGETEKFWDKEFPTEVVRTMVKTPLSESEGYSPECRFKVRFMLTKDPSSTQSISADDDLQSAHFVIEPQIYDGAQEGASEPIKNGFEMLNGGARGVWMLKINPVSIKTMSITFDLIKAKVVPRGGSYANAPFDLPTGSTLSVDGGNVGGFGSGGGDDGEPAAKRARVTSTTTDDDDASCSQQAGTAVAENGESVAAAAATTAV